ncbi:ER membrane protein complex subunit 6 [Plasmodiophora brassicae]
MVARYGEVPIENPAAPRTPNVAGGGGHRPREVRVGSRSAAAATTMDLYCAPVDLVDAANESHNDQAVSSCRVVVSAAAGCVAGLLGLRGVAGLAFFIAMSLVTSAAIALRVQGRVGRYFRSPWHVVKPGLFQGATTFVLFWTLIFNSIYIY